MAIVKITNYTSNPVETIIDEWKSTHPHESRSNDELWKFLSKSDLPILESVSINIRVYNSSIAWREQLVRNRQAGYWIQSGRETIVDKCYSSNNFFTPDSIKKNPKALEIYLNAWKAEEKYYNELIDLGIDPGDARLIIGTGLNHLVNIYTDYRNLIKLVGHRLCHIAQASLWSEIITGLEEEIKKIDARLLDPMLPECYSSRVCKFTAINETRRNTELGLLDRSNGGDFSGSSCPRWRSLNNIN